MKSHKLISAISCLRKSIVMAPLNFNVLFNLGYVFMKGSLARDRPHSINCVTDGDVI